jgi:hypothetical protein
MSCGTLAVRGPARQPSERRDAVRLEIPGPAHGDRSHDGDEPAEDRLEQATYPEIPAASPAASASALDDIAGSSFLPSRL